MPSMATIPLNQKLRDLIRSATPPYIDAERLYSDVITLLYQVTYLLPDAGLLGTSHMFYLHGTLPITYKQNSYHIPIRLYFDPTYPRAPPLAFVVPTPNMRIRPNHLHVDPVGRIFLPYLTDWQPAVSSLAEFLTILASTFSKSPPVNSMEPDVLKRESSSHALEDRFKHKVAAVWDSEVRPVASALQEQLILQENLSRTVDDMNQLVETIQGCRAKTQKDIIKLKQYIEGAKESIQDQNENKASTDMASEGEDALDKLTAADSLSSQLLEYIVTENSNEDLLAVCDEAFRNGTIDLDTLLRHVRSASREMFRARYMKKKTIEAVDRART